MKIIYVNDFGKRFYSKPHFKLVIGSAGVWAGLWYGDSSS